MVYGVYSVGKSRLLQTGYSGLKDLLPVSWEECTAHLIKINVASDGQSGEHAAKLHFVWNSVVAMESTLRDLLPDKIRCFLEEPRIREFIDGYSLWQEDGAQESPTLSLSREDVSAWARVDGNDGARIKALASVVDHIAVGVTADATCPPYNIIDAPGLGADKSRRAIAERHLRKCDVPIVVASFTDLSLEPLQESLRQIKASGHQPIIVITKLDEQIQRLRRDHRGQHLPTLVESNKAAAREKFVRAGFNAADVHFVSAEWYELSYEPVVDEIRAELAKAGLPSDEDESTARETLRDLSGIPAFWHAVNELVMRDAARRRAGRVCEELAQHLSTLLGMLLDQDGLLSGVRPDADDPEWRADVQRTSVAAKGTLDASLDAMQSECSDAIAESAMRMREGLTELVLELQKMCAGGSTVDQLSARLQQRFAELQQTLAPHQAWEVAANKMRDHLERAGEQLAELLRKHFPGSVHSLLLSSSQLQTPSITDVPSSITTPNVERNLVAAVAWAVLPRIAFVALEGATVIAAAVASGGLIALAPLMAIAPEVRKVYDAGSLANQAEAERDLPGEWVRECEEAKSGWIQDFQRGLRRQLEVCRRQVRAAVVSQLSSWIDGIEAAASLPPDQLQPSQADIRAAGEQGQVLLSDAVALLDRLSGNVVSDGVEIDIVRLGARVRRLKSSAKRWLDIDLQLADPSEEAARERREDTQRQTTDSYAFLASVLTTELRRHGSELEATQALRAPSSRPQPPQPPRGAPRPTAAAQEIARHALLARLSDEVYSRHDTGEVLFLKSADNSRVDEQVEVLHFSSSGGGTWKVPQWAVFRTAGRADGDFVALVFKGTEAPTEWLGDAACVSREAGGGLKLHAGISGNLHSHIEAVESAVARSTDAGALPLYFSGHSLGGAYAMCAFYMVAPTLSQRVAGVIGFGAPLVTVAGGPPEIVQAASQRFSTYVAGNDIVPRSLFKPNTEMMVDLERRFGRGRVLFSISNAIPTYDPVGEFRALPGAIQRSPTELLRIRPDAPLMSHIDDHACRASYARLLDERALELLPSATSTPMAPAPSPTEAAVVMAAAAAAAATAALAETEARTASIEAPFPTAQQELAQALEASEARSQVAEHRDLAHGIEESLRIDGSSPFASAAAAVQGEAGSLGSSMSTSAAESAPTVHDSPMSSPRGRAMVEFLEQAKLTAYASVLHDAGYSELTDLREADDVDLGELGLKKPEIKRLRRYLEEQV